MSISFNLSAVAAATTIALATGAGATTISVTPYSALDYATYSSSGAFVGENFESLGASKGAGEVGTDFVTNVGTFNTIGGVGSGGTVKSLPGDTGTELALRTGHVYGRKNLLPTTGAWYLDSNDTFGMTWNVATGGLFDSVAFLLSDASDKGAYLRISVDGVSSELRSNGALSNGNVKFVVINFDHAVSAATISLANYNKAGTGYVKNDGFGLDGALVRVSPVPLPPAVLMLGAGVGLLGFAGRRRRKA